MGLRQIKFVDTASGFTSATTIAATFTSAVLSGSTLVVIATGNDGTAGAYTAADDVNGSWGAALESQDDSNAAALTLIKLFAIKNSASGTPTVTITFAATTIFRALAIAEFDSVSTTDSISVHNSSIQAAPGTGTDAVTSGNVTVPTGRSGTAVAFSMNTTDSGGGPTQGTSWTDQGRGWSWEFGLIALRAETMAVTSGQTLAGTFTVASGQGSARYTTMVLVILDAAGTTGTGSAALQPFTASGSGTQTITGSGSAALSPLAADGSGAAGAAGTGSAALSPLAASGSGAESITGTGSAALSQLAASGAGAAGATGTGTAALSPLAADGSGTQVQDGTGSVALSPLAASGSGAEAFTGTASAALSPLAASGAGISGSSGSGSAALSPLSASGSAVETFTGTGSAALSPLAALGSSGALRQPPIVEYKINEATSGQAPTELVDSGSGSPFNLDLVYVSTTPTFISDATGRGLDFPTGGVDSSGARSGGSAGTSGLDIGDKPFDALDGTKTATLEFRCTMPTQTASDGLAMLFGITQEDGECDTLMAITFGSHNAFVLSFGSSATGDQAALFIRESDLSAITSGVHIFHVVLDTDATLDDDRLRLYIDTVRITLTGTLGTYSIPQGTTLAIPRPGLATGSPTQPNHHQEITLGGWFPYAAGDGGYKGKFYYAAIHSIALNTAEIAAASTRMDDFDVSGTGSAALSQLAASGSGTEAITGTASAAVSPLAAAGSGTETFTGTGSGALSPLAGSGSGTETVTGSGTAAASPLAATGTGSSVLAPITGTGSAALSRLAVAGSDFDPATGTGGIFFGGGP